MKISWSLAAVWFGWIFILLMAFFFYPKWKQAGNESTIGYDVAGYYQYLPAVFIYHDLRNLEFQDSIFAKYQLGTSFPNYEAQTGYKVIKYPVGASILYLPWFAIGHLNALASDLPADGFSKPYQTMLSWGCLLYVLIGLWFARKILLEYFDDNITAVTILLLIVGTNYLNYAAIDNAMTHSLLFTLFCLIIYNTIQFYKSARWINILLIGMLTGIAIITRPSEIVICIVPILWGVFNKETFTQRFQFLKSNILKVVVSVLLCSAVVCLQLFYWKYTTGNFIEYSYGDQGFNFLQPYIYEVLFTFRKGWFIYTPLMILIFPGFFWLYKKHRHLFFAIFLYFILTLWVVSSWEIWWYGGSLGQRALVQSYALLLFPLAAIYKQILYAKLYWKIIASVFIAYCVIVSIFFTWQAHASDGMFESENMNRAYFWKIFLKTDVSVLDKKFLDRADEFKSSTGSKEIIAQLQFEEDTFAIAQDNIIAGNHARIINAEYPFFNFEIPKEKIKEYTWLRISMLCFMQDKEWDIWKADQIAIWFKQGDERVKTNFIRIQRIADSGNWTEIYFDAQLPDEDFNTIEIAVMNLGSTKTLLIDDLTITGLKH